MSKSLVLLDLDGTLVDSLGDLVAVVNRALVEGGLSALPRTVVQAGIGHGAEHLMRHCVAQSGGSWRGQPWLARFRTLYVAGLPGAHPLYPGILGALQSLEKRGIELIVVTNKPARPARAIVAARGLAPLVTAVLGGDTLPERKPSGRMLRAAMQLVDAAPQDTVMVGDSGPDVLSARDAGVHVAAVRWGFGDPQEIPSPDRWLEHPRELADIADGWAS